MNGVTFGNYHSYNDFKLLLTDKTIGTPSPKTEIIDIPGGDGVLDFTEFFGEVKYSNRKLSFEFSTIVPRSQFMELFSTVQNALHGQKMKIVLDDDPDSYYIGRINVSEWKVDKRIGKLTVDCDCEPYKYTVKGQAVYLCGKNLINLDKTLFNGDGIWEKTETGYNFTKGTGTGGSFAYWRIPVRNGQQYVFSAEYSASAVSLYVYKDRLYGTVVAKNSGNGVVYFTAEENVRYYIGIYIGSSISSSIISNIMLLEGSATAAYEAYDNAEKAIKATFTNAGKKSAIPKALTTGAVTAETDSVFSTLTEGAYTMSEFPFPPGQTTLTFNGNGITVIEWVERGL